MRSENYNSPAQGGESTRSIADTEALIREADHRIANSLSALAGLVRMQSAEISRRAVPLSGAEVSLLQQRLLDLELDALSPREALDLLYALQGLAQKP